MANLYTPELNEEFLYTNGLRDRWYAICPSHFVERGEIKRLRRLGQDWILFRKSNGDVSMLEDRCPHRGAPLSQGTHLGDRVGCKYHGVQVDGEGTVVSVPGMPGCSIEGQRLVSAPVVREHSGAIMAWFGLNPDDEPAELIMPDPLMDEEISSFLCYAEWDSNWRFGLENLLDPMHGTFLHHESHSMAEGDTQAKFQIRESDRGFFFEKTDQKGVNFDWVELCHTGVDWVDLSIPYPKSAGPGGAFGIVGMVVPIDDKSCGVFFWRYRRVSGWLRDTWRFLYKTTLEPRHWHVLEQDRVMLEAMAPDADAAENLYQHDLGVMRLRRLFKKQAKTQARTIIAAREEKRAPKKVPVSVS
ncbi:Rieske 2Fe-2S domain-containing protein [Corynebacterium halotolerans]|uniref:Rieske 2Fe-2S domain-containing protein n=1 Tax=Corynebacterium halotolerans TaxID=225326 RepID=UPI003CF5DEC0